MRKRPLSHLLSLPVSLLITVTSLTGGCADDLAFSPDASDASDPDVDPWVLEEPDEPLVSAVPLPSAAFHPAAPSPWHPTATALEDAWRSIRREATRTSAVVAASPVLRGGVTLAYSLADRLASFPGAVFACGQWHLPDTTALVCNSPAEAVDLTLLARLPRLLELTLSFPWGQRANQTLDFTALRSSPLKTLTVEAYADGTDHRIRVSHLGALASLESLTLGAVVIVDPQVPVLPRLSSLSFFDTRGLDGLAFALGHPTLTQLTLAHVGDADLRAIAMTLPDLTVLRLHTSQVRTLAPLARLTRLEELLVESSGLIRIEGLRGLPIHTLSLVDAKVRSFAPLATLRLRSLDVVNTRFADLGLLTASAATLAHLDISYTKLVQFTPDVDKEPDHSLLLEFSALESLRMYGTPLAGCEYAPADPDLDEAPTPTPGCCVLRKLREREALLLETSEPGC